MADKTKKLKVTFTQQQLELLDKLKEERAFGKSYLEIVVNVFRGHVSQVFRGRLGGS